MGWEQIDRGGRVKADKFSLICILCREVEYNDNQGDAQTVLKGQMLRSTDIFFRNKS